VVGLLGAAARAWRIVKPAFKLRVLILAPLSTHENWRLEIANGLLAEPNRLFTKVISPQANLRADLLAWNRLGGVVVMTPDLFRNMVGPKAIQRHAFAIPYLLDPGPDIIVVDEGHSLANAKSGKSLALEGVATKRRIVLTGTPLQNRLDDLHSVVSFARPGLLPPLHRFRGTYTRPCLEGSYVDSSKSAVSLMKRRLHMLNKKYLAVCMHRRGFEVLQGALPPKEEYVLSIRLSPLQHRLYHLFRSLARSRFIESFQILQTITNHPLFLKELRSGKTGAPALALTSAVAASRLLGATGVAPVMLGSAAAAAAAATPTLAADSVAGVPDAPIPRLWWLPELLAQALTIDEGGKLPTALAIIQSTLRRHEKIIVFSQYIAVLEVIALMLQHLDDRELKRHVHFAIFTGRETSAERQAMQDRFNDSTNQLSVLLVSIKVCTHNEGELQTFRCFFWLSPPDSIVGTHVQPSIFPPPASFFESLLITTHS
jgi:SNF2 family DNA or RNA helicase